MIRYYFLSGLITIASILFFSSCQRDSVPTEPARFRIAQIKTSSFFIKGDSAFLQYGSSGKLTSYTVVAAGSTLLGTINYNEKGQLTRSEEKPAPGVASYSNYRTYTYDQAGNLTIEVYATPYNSQTYSLRRIDKIEYNSQALPVKAITTTYTENGKLMSTNIDEYTYADGNLVSLKVTEPTTPRTTTTTFDYDNKPNPFYGILGFSSAFGGSAYNRNNFIARRGGLEEDVKNEITYDANGLMISQQLNANLILNRQIKYFYKYESY